MAQGGDEMLMKVDPSGNNGTPNGSAGRHDNVSRIYISRVCVTNFMCHAHMQVDLGPYTNFIIGRNGSTCDTFLVTLRSAASVFWKLFIFPLAFLLIFLLPLILVLIPILYFAK